LKRRLVGATYQLIKILSRQVGSDQSGGKPPHSKFMLTADEDHCAGGLHKIRLIYSMTGLFL
jgi:hypothetical protein